MKLRLVKASNQYCDQIKDMLDEWNAAGEKIIPYAIRRVDYHDFAYYCDKLEIKDTSDGFVPDSTFFCWDEERDIKRQIADIYAEWYEECRKSTVSPNLPETMWNTMPPAA